MITGRLRTVMKAIPKGVLIAVLLLLVVEFAVARQEWPWRFEPRSSSGIVDALETQVIEPAPDPAVIVLGSSRIRDAIAPRALEENLDLDEGTVLNLGLTGGNLFDALSLYERNRIKLGEAEIAVIGVELGDFVSDPGVSNRVRRFATLEDRLAWPGEGRASLLIGSVWRTYDAREPIRGVITSPLRDNQSELPISEDGRVVWREPVAEGPEEIDDVGVADGFFGEDDPGAGHAASLEELIGLLTEDGVQVLIVYLPVRDSFADVIDDEYPHLMAGLKDQLQAFNQSANVLVIERASLVPRLLPIHFYDYGHATNVGGLVLSDYYGNVLRDRFPDLVG